MKTTRWIPILWVGLLMGGLPLAATTSVHAEEDLELFPLLEELDTEDSLPVLEEELPLLPAETAKATPTATPVTQAPVYVAQQPAAPAETAAIPEPPVEMTAPAQPPVEIPVVEAAPEPAPTQDDLLTPPAASPKAPLTEESSVVVPEPAAPAATEPLPATTQEVPTTVLPPAPPAPATPNTSSQSVVVSKTEVPATSTETVVPATTTVPYQECCECIPVYPRRTPVVRYGMPVPMGYGAYGVPARGYGRYYERGTRRLLPDTGYTVRGPRDFDDPNPRPIGP